MSAKTQIPQPFPVLQSFGMGLRLSVSHFRLFGVLSFFPFLVSLATLIVIRVMDAHLTMFWVPILQLPSSFVIGLLCALILRFIVLHEHPLAPEGEDKSLRNRAVMQSSIVYAAISYFITGLHAGLLHLQGILNNGEPAVAAPYAPLAIALVVFVFWAARWFWLHIPVALDWPVAAFYQRIGGWIGSLKIFGLYALCSLLMNIVATLVRSLIATVSGGKASGIMAAFDDGAVAVATLLLAVVFTSASAAAVKIMAGAKIKDVEV
jgi:hypothetical protein